MDWFNMVEEAHAAPALSSPVAAAPAIPALHGAPVNSDDDQPPVISTRSSEKRPSDNTIVDRPPRRHRSEQSVAAQDDESGGDLQVSSSRNAAPRGRAAATAPAVDVKAYNFDEDGNDEAPTSRSALAEVKTYHFDDDDDGAAVAPRAAAAAAAAAAAPARYFSPSVPKRPPHFHDETSSLYISEAFWNELDPVHLTILAGPFRRSIWEVVRLEAFAPKSAETNGTRNFGELWLHPLVEAEVASRIQQAPTLPTLHNHIKHDKFLDRTVFWHEKAKLAVTERCTFVGPHTFPVELRPVGPAGTATNTTLLSHLMRDGTHQRLAIVRGVSGSGKTVALLHHPHDATVVTFYLNADWLLELNDSRTVAAHPTFSDYFTERVTAVADKNRRDEAAQSAVVTGVLSLLGGIGCSSDPSVKVLVAIDEAGNHAQFVRALCSCYGEIQEKLRKQFGTPTVLIAVAGTGVESSVLAPGSENDRYLMFEPITPVWDGLCRNLTDLQGVLPRDPLADTRVHKLAREFVGNARAAWALATVFTSRRLKMTVDKTLATSALPDLCAEAARLLREKNGLSKVSEQSLPYLFVHAAFLQCQITPLVGDDFLLASKFGVISDTATLFDNKTSPPQEALANGRALTTDEACLESNRDKAYVEEELRRFEMPATFTAWLHFSLGFGLQSPAGDGLEELTAQYAALALMARKASYFTPAYWSVVEKRCRARGVEVPWKVPFYLFDLLSQLPGRESRAAVDIFHLGTRFDPGSVVPDVDAVKAALGDKVTRHKVVINGPKAEFADVLVFPQGSRTLCLIQCKGSDKVNDAAGSHFSLRDLFTELYKMGCEDDMSCLAGCLNKAQRSSAPEWTALYGVEEFAVAACLEARAFAQAFDLGVQIIAERVLFANCTPAQKRALKPAIDNRNAADANLLKKLQQTPLKDLSLQVSSGEFPDLASDAAHQSDAFVVLKSALDEQTKALEALKNSRPAKGPLANAVATLCKNAKDTEKITKLLKAAKRRPATRGPPFWLSTNAPNPSATLLDALLKTVPCAETKRVVLVWNRPVDAVPAWSVPQGCTLVQAEPWDGKTWPPTSLYPLMEQSAHDRCATMIGPADISLKRSDQLLLPPKQGSP